jgi:hypothetical protein
MLRILIASYSIVIGRDAYKGTPASKPKNKEKINDSPFFVRQSHIIRATGAFHSIICSRLSWQGRFCQGFTGTVAHRYCLCTLHEDRAGIGTMGMTTRCRTGYVNSRGREGGLERGARGREREGVRAEAAAAVELEKVKRQAAEEVVANAAAVGKLDIFRKEAAGGIGEALAPLGFDRKTPVKFKDAVGP